jgi:hypothetical protein
VRVISFRRLFAALVVSAAVAIGVSSAAAQSPSRSATVGRCPLPRFGPGAAYHPRIDPRAFGADVTNPWFPLPVGRTWVYSGVKDGAAAVDVVTATARSRIVGGVRTRVVEDRLLLDGLLRERTADYYAQDRCGDVWYFGEDTATLRPDGTVDSTEGTWHHGVDGARAGVFMAAHPERGRRFRQEWYAGHAEDTFRAIDLDAGVRVPYGSFDHALRTEETTELEPGVVDNKYYVRGVGEISELAVQGDTEHLELVTVVD